MADPHLKVFAVDDLVTPVATLETVTKKGSNTWQWRAGADGSGSFTAKGSISAAALAETVIVVVNDGTNDVFAFVPTSKVRRALDAPGETEVDLSGPGLPWILHDMQLLQEDTSDCAEPSGERWFGYMSGDFDDSAWTAALSHGTYVSRPFVTPRPKGWKDPFAHLIGPSISAVAARTWYARRQFTLASDIDAFVQAAADDEYRLFLDGEPLFDTIGGGAFQWKRFQQLAKTICSGTHTLAVEVRNLDRASAATNYTWFLASILPANTTTGEPEASDQQWAVYHDHTGGTFTLSSWFGGTTSAIAYNASAGDVQTALEAILGSGNVTVTGSGTVASPWIVTMGGDLSSLHIPLTADGSNLTGGTAIETDEYVRGGHADPVVRTDTDWVILDNPATPPGLTAGEILRIAHLEAKARGATRLDYLTRGCTTTLDSAGNAWAGELNLPVPLNADLHDVCRVLNEAGYITDVAPDLTLNCWNPGGRGTDLSATVTVTAWMAGVQNLAATRSEMEIANAFRVRTDEGWHWATDATSITARLRRESGMSLEGFADEASAKPVTDQLLAQFAEPPHTTTFDINSDTASGIVPHKDVDPYDIATIPGFSTTPDSFTATAMRLVGITGTVQEKAILYSTEWID